MQVTMAKQPVGGAHHHQPTPTGQLTVEQLKVSHYLLGLF